MNARRSQIFVHTVVKTVSDPTDADVGQDTSSAQT